MDPARLRPASWAQSPSCLMSNGDPHRCAVTAGLVYDEAAWDERRGWQLAHGLAPFTKQTPSTARRHQNCDRAKVARRLTFAQYLSIRYTERFAIAGIEPSVGSVGDFYDNALAESIIGLFKTEAIWRRGPWKSFGAVELATLEWVDWFNNRRLLEPIGNIPPAQAEARYYASQQEVALAA